MIRRLFIVAVSLAALTACTTYNSGYRNYSPAQAGYGDYYYAPDPGPSYYSPGYLHYPAYYSLYWGFDRHYYSSWHRPHFHYGVTWFPNDWFAFSVGHRYPSYRYWHPYAPYRYSAWDHRFAWHHYSPPPRYRYRSAPRYGHPSNERHMQREHLAGGSQRRMAPGAGAPRARSAVQAAAPQRMGNTAQRAAYRPESAMVQGDRGAALPPGTARMRPQADQARAATLREQAARARPTSAVPAPRAPAQRPWQEAQPAPRARSRMAPDASPPRSIPDRRDSQGPRQMMGDPRGVPVREGTSGRMQAPRSQDPRLGEAPRARPTAPASVQQQRTPMREAPRGRQDMRQMPARPPAQAPAAPRRNAMPQRPPGAVAPTAPTAPQPRMQQAAPQRAAPAPPPTRQAAPPPTRQAAPPPPRQVPQRSSGRSRTGLIDREP